jgi:hypothetical protein
MRPIALHNYLLNYALNRLAYTHADSANFAKNQRAAAKFESCLLKNHAIMALLKPKPPHSMAIRLQRMENVKVALKLMATFCKTML